MALFTQDTISLHTNNGSTGYRIKKFEIIPEAPGGSSSVEHVLKIYSVAQTGTPDATVDMSDNTLRPYEEVMTGYLGAGGWSDGKLTYSTQIGG